MANDLNRCERRRELDTNVAEPYCDGHPSRAHLEPLQVHLEPTDADFVDAHIESMSVGG